MAQGADGWDVGRQARSGVQDAGDDGEARAMPVSSALGLRQDNEEGGGNVHRGVDFGLFADAGRRPQ